MPRVLSIHHAVDTPALKRSNIVVNFARSPFCVFVVLSGSELPHHWCPCMNVFRQNNVDHYNIQRLVPLVALESCSAGPRNAKMSKKNKATRPHDERTVQSLLSCQTGNPNFNDGCSYPKTAAHHLNTFWNLPTPGICPLFDKLHFKDLQQYFWIWKWLCVIPHQPSEIDLHKPNTDTNAQTKKYKWHQMTTNSNRKQQPQMQTALEMKKPLHWCRDANVKTHSAYTPHNPHHEFLYIVRRFKTIPHECNTCFTGGASWSCEKQTYMGKFLFFLMFLILFGLGFGMFPGVFPFLQPCAINCYCLWFVLFANCVFQCFPSSVFRLFPSFSTGWPSCWEHARKKLLFVRRTPTLHPSCFRAGTQPKPKPTTNLLV